MIKRQITFAQLRAINDLVLQVDPMELIAHMENNVMPLFTKQDSPQSWYYQTTRFIRTMERFFNGKDSRLYSAVFMRQGNSKLPFYAYSVLPFITCIGAGTCLDFCYTPKSWRNAAAYLRQLQNTLLQLHCLEIIREQFLKIPRDQILRSYVDGDFDRYEVLKLFMELCHDRSDLTVYGYSKSWNLFLTYDRHNVFPDNYMLNLSSGSIYDDDPIMLERMMQLSCVRGLFTIVNVNGFDRGAKKYDDPRYHAEVRKRLRDQYPDSKVFSCTGYCGTCCKDQIHACANPKFRNVIIGNAKH